MSRTPDKAKRVVLIEGALVYFAKHGIATTSLRPLADALGTSDRMLVHYFGSKDALIREVLVVTRPDVDALIESHRGEASSLATHLWRDLTARGRQEPRVRVLLQVMNLSTTEGEPYRSFAQDATRRWIKAVAAVLRPSLSPIDAEAAATALISGLRGLALDRFATGDQARTDRAARVLISALLA